MLLRQMVPLREGGSLLKEAEKGDGINVQVKELNGVSSEQKIKELWEWAREGLKREKSWYGNLYKKGIAAAKAMQDPYVAHLEEKYKAWQKKWKL